MFVSLGVTLTIKRLPDHHRDRASRDSLGVIFYLTNRRSTVFRMLELLLCVRLCATSRRLGLQHFRQAPLD